MILLLVAVAAATVAVLIALGVALTRHLRRLTGALADLEREMTPLLEGIRRDADLTRERLEGLEARASARGSAG